jgi:hypothetical protein
MSSLGMKKLIILPTLAILAFASVPGTSQALSCIDPEGMIEYIVSDPNSIVVTATVKEMAERVDKKALKDDPNGMYDSGYTGQFIEIEEAHMGTVPDSQWVYFRRDATWNYLCAGAPPKVGAESIYVIQMPQSVFELQTVVTTYPVDSEIGKDLLEAIADAESEVEPAIYEVPKSDWVTRLHDELKEMAFIVKVKLAEWQFWHSAK